jgi:uncharacterized membrane protein
MNGELKMTLRNRLQDHNVLIRIGLVFLILASLWKWFLHPGAHFSAGFIDGATGLLYGVSIGCMLLGLRLKSRRRSPAEGMPCAR